MTDTRSPSHPSDYVVDCALDAWFEGRTTWRQKAMAHRLRNDMRRAIEAADGARVEEAKKAAGKK